LSPRRQQTFTTRLSGALVEHGQVEFAQARGAGDDVDLHELSPADREGHDDGQPPMRCHHDSHRTVHQRHAGVRCPPGEAERLPGDGPGAADRSWAVRGVDGPIRPTAKITIDPLDGGTRSRVTFALDFEGHGVGVPLLPLVRRQAQKSAPMSYQHLKARLDRAAR
jgi:hypothetical protein